MTAKSTKKRDHFLPLATAPAICLLGALAGAFPASAQNGSAYFNPGNLVVSRSVYVDTGSIIANVTVLPPNCSTSNCPTPVTAAVSSAYPYVWNNDSVDGSFGVTSKIFLDQLTPTGMIINSLEVPNSSQNGVPPTKDQMVTSFSSKSEMALNLSTDGSYLTLMGYFAPIGAIDVSNSNTPGVIDSTNPVGVSTYRSVAQVDQKGKFRFTITNAYSGNNGRAAILNNTAGANLFYAAGNAGNGNNPQPEGIVIGAGAQVLTPEVKAVVAQSPGAPSPVASFNITQLGHPHDKIGKDDNFRGLRVFDNVLYYTKGSGSNGVNTVYFVDTTGTVCYDARNGGTPSGVGLPVAGASLPVAGLTYDPTTVATTGLPDNMCILQGFPTLLAKSNTGVSYPFGIWFANATTLYVADEGNGTAGKTVADFYTPAASTSNPTAGLQKWVFASGKWQLAYTLTAGLGLGVPYSVPNSPAGDMYPIGNNEGTGGTGFPWAPAPDGLRNLIGVVNSDGTATIYAITSTISGSGDQGADPNQLVTITDTLSATGPNPPASENFTVLKTAAYGEVLRGVSWTPGTDLAGH